uniref:Progonadoliberin n=1 Tax=Geotrypetes seraphini TaxID=260995 RepID=A0A6P8R7K1_GEOSA|nr:progonadoliberin-1 [Geotrypetes seraphini]
MQMDRKLMIRLFFIVISLEICCAQHWSYGLRPGGKRDSEMLMDSYQEVSNEVDKFAEPHLFECSLPQQHSRFSTLKGALASLLEEKIGRTKL